MSKIIRFRHPDECDWEDVVQSSLGELPEGVTEADFNDIDAGPIQAIPLASRKSVTAMSKAAAALR